MRTSLRAIRLIILAFLPGAVIGQAQTPTPTPSPSPGQAPMKMPMPGKAPVQTGQDTSGGQPQPSAAPFPPPKDWPSPVEDEMKYTLVLADVLEYRPARNGGDFRWDVEGWYGGDFNRFWFKSEGERDTSFKANYDIDLQLLYGRFVRKFYDFQVGLRIETQNFRGANVTRPQFVIGLEGLVPYRYELETALFISPQGHVAGRASFTRDFLFTQRLILQGRFEAHLAAQRVERFTTGRGLNNIEAGLRLRYEFRRKFGPYIGVSYDRSFFGTADLVRQDGGDPKQLRFVAGVRVWR